MKCADSGASFKHPSGKVKSVIQLKQNQSSVIYKKCYQHDDVGNFRFVHWWKYPENNSCHLLTKQRSFFVFSTCKNPTK